TIKVDNGPGGTDVGRFEAAVTIPNAPPALTWTNFDTIVAEGIDRDSDLNVTWKGGDTGTEYVVIGGAVFVGGLEKLQSAVGFICAERAEASQLTVPSIVLSALPASDSNDPVSAMLIVGRAPFLGAGSKFTAPGLDAAYATFASFKLRPITFR
ncbi:MAG: hypothetical protein NTY38_10990, partial [Acidobacteria bacterium]|nr:hypothetical protein [Acidobacteriota bacterium]